MCEEMQGLALNVHELSKKMARKRKVIYIRKCDCVWLYVEESEGKGK